MTVEAIQPLVTLALQEPGMEEKQGQHVTDLHQFLSLMSDSRGNVSYLSPGICESGTVLRASQKSVHLIPTATFLG